MSQTSSNPATLRLPFKEKLAYGMGDLGSNILLDIGTLYLLKFYTDVLGLPELMAVSFSLSPSFLPRLPIWGLGLCSTRAAKSARKANSARSFCMPHFQ